MGIMKRLKRLKECRSGTCDLSRKEIGMFQTVDLKDFFLFGYVGNLGGEMEGAMGEVVQRVRPRSKELLPEIFFPRLPAGNFFYFFGRRPHPTAQGLAPPYRSYPTIAIAAQRQGSCVRGKNCIGPLLKRWVPVAQLRQLVNGESARRANENHPPIRTPLCLFASMRSQCSWSRSWTASQF